MEVGDRYDVIYIGGGGASYPGAFELAKKGKKVLLVDDKGLLGGVCTYAGCVPSKALRRWGLTLMDAEVRGGVRIDPDELWGRAVDAKDRVQSEVFRQLRWVAGQLHDNLDFVKGWATIRDERRATVRTEEGERTVETRFMHVGAGSVNVVPDIPGKELAITSDDLYRYEGTPRELYDSLIIIGAGYVGVETAYALSMFKVKVTLIEMMDRPLPNMPIDVSRSVLRGLQKLGVDVKLGSRASSISRRDGRLLVRAARRDGSASEVEGDAVMISVGRRPRVEGYGLESLAGTGLDYSARGVKVNAYMRTTLPNVFASGDVTGGAMLYHSAVVGSLTAAKNIEAGADTYQYNDRLIPRVVFTFPEAGYVGLSEDELRASGVQYNVIRYSMKANSASLIEGHTDSWVKLLVDSKSGRVLGAEAHAPEAASILTAVAVSMMGGLKGSDLYWLAAPHPTPMEAMAEGFRLWELLR